MTAPSSRLMALIVEEAPTAEQFGLPSFMGTLSRGFLDP